MSKKMVVQVSIHDVASQKKAVSAVSGLAGIVSIVSDIASSKLTVTGDLNPVAIIKQLKKNKCSPHLEELGPVKDEEAEAKKKKEEEEKKKKEEEEKKRKEEEEKKRMIWNQACNRPMIFEVMCENPSYW